MLSVLDVSNKLDLSFICILCTYKSEAIYVWWKAKLFQNYWFRFAFIRWYFYAQGYNIYSVLFGLKLFILQSDSAKLPYHALIIRNYALVQNNPIILWLAQLWPLIR